MSGLCSLGLVTWRLVVDRLSVLFLRLLLSLQRLQHLLWWLLELHIVKIVSFYIIWVSVKEVRIWSLSFSLSVCLSDNMCDLSPWHACLACLSLQVFAECVSLSTGVCIESAICTVCGCGSALQGLAPPVVRNLYSLDLCGNRLQDVVPTQCCPTSDILIQLHYGNCTNSDCLHGL